MVGPWMKDILKREAEGQGEYDFHFYASFGFRERKKGRRNRVTFLEFQFLSLYPRA